MARYTSVGGLPSRSVTKAHKVIVQTEAGTGLVSLEDAVNAVGAVTSVISDTSPVAVEGGSVSRAIKAKLGDVISVKDFGAVCDNATDDITAVNAAHAAALAGGFAVHYPGVCKVSANIANFHTVSKTGPGGVRLNGRTWWATPNNLVNTFSARQTIYVNPAQGSDTNAGLGTGTFAVKTIQAAFDILTKYSFLPGFWSVTLAAGEYTDKAKLIGTSNTQSRALYVEGPTVASAWNNTTPPADADATGGSVPTAIIRPVLAGRGNGAGIALDFEGNLNVAIQNIKVRDFGTNGVTGDEGAFRIRTGWMRATNCHVWDSGVGVMGRDFAQVSIEGGLYHGLRRSLYCVAGARYNTGVGASAAGQSTSALIRQCVFGIDIWENSTGHPDFAIFEDNGVHINLRKGGHAALIGPTFRNTGGFGPSTGIAVADNAIFLLDGTEIWTGTHARLFDRTNGGQNMADTGYEERLLAWNNSDQTTSGTTALTVASLAVEKGDFSFQPQAIIVRMVLATTTPTAVGNITLRKNGTFIGTVIVSTTAGTVNAFAELLIRHTGADRSNAQLFSGKFERSNTNGTATAVSATITDVTQDFTTSDWTLNVNVGCSNAADSITVKSVEIWRRG
jgi:hypothetical protein